MELRRGALTLAVLAALQHEHYGYSLRKTLLDASIEIEEGTLYPLIRRLETHGLLRSEWREHDSRKKRYYLITPAGETALDELRRDWAELSASLTDLLENGT
jgi:PadR family transcriptional regulator PadR